MDSYNMQQTKKNNERRLQLTVIMTKVIQDREIVSRSASDGHNRREYDFMSGVSFRER